MFALSFFLSWLAFAVIWWLIAFTHGDLEEMHLPPNQGERVFSSQYKLYVDFVRERPKK